MSEIKYDFLANQKSVYIDEITQLKIKQWKYTAPTREYSEWNQQVLESCNKTIFPISFIAYNSNELVGFLTVIFSENRFSYENSFWIITLYIKEKFRGNGIAKKLLKFTEMEILKLNINKIYLWTDNEMLNDFYIKQKWQYLKKVYFQKNEVSILTKILG